MNYGGVVSKNFSAGGTMGGDLTISGDLTVSGEGGFAYSEVLEGNLSITQTADQATGIGLYVSRDLASSATNAPLVKIVNDNSGDDQTALWIQQDGASYGVYIDTNASSNHSMIFDQPATTDAAVIRIDGAGALTTGAIFNANITSANLETGGNTGAFRIIHSANSGSKIANIMHLHNDHASSVAVVPLKIQQDSTGSALELNGSTSDDFAAFKLVNSKSQSNSTAFGTYIDFEFENSVGTSTSRFGVIEDGVDDWGAFYFSTKASAGTPTERMRINHDGNVGIGTTPQSPLHLHQATSGATYMQFTNSTTGNSDASSGTRIGLDLNEKFVIYHQEDTDINFFTGATPTQKMTILSGGNVGIGIATPAAALEINSDGAAFEVASASGTNRFSVDGGGTIATNANFTIGTNKTFTGGNCTLNLNASGSNNSTTIQNSDDIILQPTSGNVGIGESVPLGKLHIKTADSGASVTAHGDELVVEGSARSGISILSGNTSKGGLYFADDGSNDIGSIRYDHNDNSLEFITKGTADRIRITSAGNVGIGIAAPTAMLEVNNITINSDDYTSSDDFLGIRGNFKYTGASGKDFDSGEDLYGAIIAVEFDDSQSAGAFRNLIAVNGDSTATDCADSGEVVGGQFRGKVGHADADVNNVIGVEATALITDGTVDTNTYGVKVLVDGDDGAVAGDVFGVDIDVDIESPLEVAGDVIGMKISVDDDDASAGDCYGMQINCASNVDAAIDLVGGGIKFPATQAASANANTLDDYEEGTWTPTLTNMTIGNGAVVATYTKIGRLVHLNCKVTLGGTSSVDGAWTFTNLPFAVPNNSVPIQCMFEDSGTATFPAWGFVVSNVVYLRGIAGNAAINATTPFTWATGDVIYWSVVYED